MALAAVVLPEECDGELPELAMPLQFADESPPQPGKKRGRPKGSGGIRPSKKPAAAVPKAAGKAKPEAKAKSSEKKRDKESKAASQDLRDSLFLDPGMQLVIGNC